MPLSTILDRLHLTTPGVRRSRRRLTPAVRPLEGRQLLSGVPISGTMTQTATFPNLESQPNVANQALLYFSPSMGTLTEVDLVTSGSYTTQFYAENLGSTSGTITGTTNANLSINVPSGPVAVTIPSTSESFNAGPYDGTLNYGGTSGKDFATESSSSATDTTVLTSPADLAAFTGQFRIPITVSGHATGNASSSNGDLSDGFNTQTSVTLTVIYHYTSDPTSQDPPTSSGDPTPTSGTPGTSSASPTSSSPTTPTGTGSQPQPLPSQPQQTTTKGRKEKSKVPAPPPHHKVVQHASTSRAHQASVEHTSSAKAHTRAKKR
jgi:hypothetical protein